MQIHRLFRCICNCCVKTRDMELGKSWRVKRCANWKCNNDFTTPVNTRYCLDLYTHYGPTLHRLAYYTLKQTERQTQRSQWGRLCSNIDISLKDCGWKAQMCLLQCGARLKTGCIQSVCHDFQIEYRNSSPGPHQLVGFLFCNHRGKGTDGHWFWSPCSILTKCTPCDVAPLINTTHHHRTWQSGNDVTHVACGQQRTRRHEENDINYTSSCSYR